MTALLDYIAYRGQVVATSPLADPLPDSDDEPFLEVANGSKAAYLITGNQDHFPADLCQGTKVVSTQQFLTYYEKQKKQKKRITKA